MSCEFKTLLPHPSKVELALEEEAAQKYCRANPQIIRDIHDPWKCPLEFLPWLAYALSVDVWNDKWPEVTKRTICANAEQIHEHKGTHGGMVDALALLGIRADVVYWHQMQPEGEPGTMNLTLWVSQNIIPDAEVILGSELIRDVKRQIESNKRASLHYSFRIGMELTTQVATAASAHFATAMDAKIANTRIDIQPQNIGVGLGCLANFSTRMAMGYHNEAVDITPQKTGLKTAFMAQFSTRTDVNMKQSAIHVKSKKTGFIQGFLAQFSTLMYLEMTV